MVRNFLIYVLIVIVTMILRIGTGGYVTKLILFLVFAFPIIQFLYAVYMLFRIQAEIEQLPEQMIQGERNEFGIKITNKSLLPLIGGRLHVKWKNNFTGEVIREKIDFSILSQSMLSLKCFRTDAHCGMVSFKVSSVDVYDMVFMWKLKKIGRDEKQVLIRPPYQSMDVSRQLNTGVWKSENVETVSSKKGESVEGIVDIRSYQQGDKLQKVHWNLSAKMDDIMIKEFGAPLDVDTHILIELYTPHSKKKGYYMDGMLLVVASLSIQMVQAGEIHKICWFDGEELQVRKINSQMALWDCIETILMGTMEKEPQAAEIYMRRKGIEHSQVYYVGAGWNKKSGEQLGELARQEELTAFLVDDYVTWEVDEELRAIYENGHFSIRRIQTEIKKKRK